MKESSESKKLQMTKYNSEMRKHLSEIIETIQNDVEMILNTHGRSVAIALTTVLMWSLALRVAFWVLTPVVVEIVEALQFAEQYYTELLIIVLFVLMVFVAFKIKTFQD